MIDASELFGLRKAEKNIVSNVARYHRGSVPRETHIPYMSLPKADRATVSKLAAILRVAESLDHSRQQKIKNFTLKAADDAYTLWIPEDAGDVSVERDALREKGDLFADVFGSPISLKQAHAKTGP